MLLRVWHAVLPFPIILVVELLEQFIELVIHELVVELVELVEQLFVEQLVAQQFVVVIAL
jgi:hypothetical protein